MGLASGDGGNPAGSGRPLRPAFLFLRRQRNLMNSSKDSNEAQLEKDFRAFMEALADEGIIRRVTIDGVNFYFREGDPEYEEYLARKDENTGGSRSRYA